MTDNSDSTDEEYEGLLKRALDVELPENFNPDSIPQDGHEYLQHVIYERSRCKKLVTANIDPNKFKNNQTFCVKLDEPTKKIPKVCLPSKEWQFYKLEEFKDFKNCIERYIHTEPTVTEFDEDNFINNIIKEPPFFSQLITYSQSAKIRMLQIITKHMNAINIKPVDNKLGTWIFAILSLLDIPLSPSYCHTIREFAKKCLEIRSQLSDDAEEDLYTPLNFYICIISRYFSQLDLSD